MSMTRTQEFIQKQKKKLVSGAAFFNPDTSMQPKSNYDKAKLKVLYIFPTPMSVKTVSSTAAALNDYVIEHCPDVFVDFAYIPENTDLKLYDEFKIPYAIGHITHLDPSHFDVIGFSISVLHEVVACPTMIKSFERCDKPIDLFWSQRKDKPIGEQPIIYAGGITAACGDIMFGQVGKEQAFVDFLYLGACDKQDVLYKRLIQAKETGKVSRDPQDNFKPGYELITPENFVSELSVSTNQEYIESLFDLNFIYQPQAYKVTYNKYGRITENIKINDKAQDFVEPFYPHELLPDLGIGRTIINASGDNCGTAQIQCSEGCSAGGQCSFCSEGCYTGGWVEKSREQILKELVETKKHNAAYKFKPFSFNMNYLTDYKGMLGEFVAKYPKVTFINMRMEELGRDPDALVMMKMIGSNRLSAPLEGMSPRIMNNLLNKCLSEESIDGAMSYCVHGKMTDVKIGGIFTCYEEDQDFQWMCDFFDKYNNKAKEEGGNFTGRLKFTPLVHYALTTIEYLERRSAKNSFLGKRWLSDEWYEKFKEHNVHFKVNGFRYSTFIEQSIVDQGRRLTPLIYKHFVTEGVGVYSLRSVATDEFVEELKYMVDPYHKLETLTDEQKAEQEKHLEGYFGDRNPESYISPAHRIHIELMGSYIPRARRLLRAKQSGDIYSMEPDIRCLKTYDGAKVKCYHNCIKDEPLKMYFDVQLSEGGLIGESYDLLGCERCQTPEQRRDRLARPTPQTLDAHGLGGIPRIPMAQKLRFVIRRNAEYDVLNPNNTAHTFIAKLLQLSDNLLDSYHSIVNHNMFWQADPQIKYYTSGIQIVDTYWQKNVLDEVRSLLDKLNDNLESVQVMSVQEILRDEKLKIDDINVFYFKSQLPYAQFESAMHYYDGRIKVYGGMGTAETIKDPKLTKPSIMTKGCVEGIFTLPLKYNPVEYMSGLLSSIKKTSADQVVATTEFNCLMTLRETAAVCKKCGNEHAFVSINTGAPIPLGETCLKNALLTMRVKE